MEKLTPYIVSTGAMQTASGSVLVFHHTKKQAEDMGLSVLIEQMGIKYRKRCTSTYSPRNAKEFFRYANKQKLSANIPHVIIKPSHIAYI